MWNWKFQLSNHRLGSLGNQPPPWGCPGAPSHLISKTCTTWEIPSSGKQGRDQIRISYMTDTYHFQVFFLNLGLDLGAVSERITKKAGWSGWCLWIIIIFLKRCERIGIHFTKSKWIFFFSVCIMTIQYGWKRNKSQGHSVSHFHGLPFPMIIGMPAMKYDQRSWFQHWDWDFEKTVSGSISFHLRINVHLCLFIYFFSLPPTALCSFINHSSTVASVRSGQNWDLKVNRYSASNNLKEATTYSFHRHVFTEPIQY